MTEEGGEDRSIEIGKTVSWLAGCALSTSADDSHVMTAQLWTSCGRHAQIGLHAPIPARGFITAWLATGVLRES